MNTMQVGQRVRYVLRDWPYIYGEEGTIVRVFETGGFTVKLDSGDRFTTRQGFEVMLRRVAPEIVDIIDTTEHEAGKKPFYQRTV